MEAEHDPQIVPLFATPIAMGALPGESGLLATLAGAILDRRAHETGVAASRFGEAWRSEADFATWGGGAAAVLRREIIEAADRLTLDVNGTGRYRWQIVMRAFAARAGESDMTKARPDAFWTAVYFVADGGSGHEPGSGGELVIEDPRLPATLMEAPRLRLRMPNGGVYNEEAALRPTPGLLILFPSWLRIRHRLHQGNGERLWISADLVAQRKSP